MLEPWLTYLNPGDMVEGFDYLIDIHHLLVLAEKNISLRIIPKKSSKFSYYEHQHNFCILHPPYFNSRQICNVHCFSSSSSIDWLVADKCSRLWILLRMLLSFINLQSGQVLWPTRFCSGAVFNQHNAVISIPKIKNIELLPSTSRWGNFWRDWGSKLICKLRLAIRIFVLTK